MKPVVRVGVAQVNAHGDLAENLAVAEKLLQQAAHEGVELIAFPEMFLHLSADRADKFAVAEPVDGPLVQQFQQWAQRFNLSILMGSHYEPIPEDPERLYNTSVFIDRTGVVQAVYRKIHLFDVPTLDVLESSLIAPGQEPVVVEHELACLGLSICYDLRFPELYRHLAGAGAEILLVPAAFYLETGKDHWLPLLQARAIENQAYVLAPAQWGWHYGSRRSFGNSVIIDPWGTLLATAPEATTLITARLEHERLQAVRERVPAWQHRRPHLYPIPHSSN